MLRRYTTGLHYEMLIKYIIYLNIIYTCMISSLGIDSDYYFEDESKQQNISTFEATPLFLHNKTHNTSVDEMDLEINDGEQNEFHYATKETFIENISTVVEKKTESAMEPDHHKIIPESILTNPSEFIKPLLNIFNEYEYIYDDEKYHIPDNQYGLNENDVLVSGRKNKQKIHNILNRTIKVKNQKPKKIKLNLLDYYSLEPASAYVNIDNGKLLSEDGDVWYVPQDLPCWQLPLLYGELGYREKSSDVFSINRAYLKNVVHQENNKKSFPKVTQFAETLTFNKWCEIEPCYGDHTLCLFPEKVISNLCETEYIVKAPTIFEQMALINTINSMRNRIAIGQSIRYSHLPPAANMMQVTYDFDLEKMAYAWLGQCLPGPAPCSALDGSFVSQLECKKSMKRCCQNSSKTGFHCTPLAECFVIAVVGCIHAWYWSAGENISSNDIQCGHIESSTFNTVQLIWGNTHKIGCAFGVSTNGDVRVVCNFSPGAPFYIKRAFFCGLLPHYDITDYIDSSEDITNLTFLSSLGIKLDEINTDMYNDSKINSNYQEKDKHLKVSKRVSNWGVDSLSKIYQEGWVSGLLRHRENGTIGMLARLITQFTFYEESQARCDTKEPIYIKGKPGSLCSEKGRRYPALCYYYGDPTPGYRLVAILAPVTLFSLILYDLFSSAVRQSIY